MQLPGIRNLMLLLVFLAARSLEAGRNISPLWLQADGRDHPVSVENDTPFPSSRFITGAQWTTPRYYPNPKVQAADILPVTWARDGFSYAIGDDGSVYGQQGTTVLMRILGRPQFDNNIPAMNFELLGRDIFPYGCPKSVSEKSCYSVGLTVVDDVFYAPTYDNGYPVAGDNYKGHARMDYSPAPLSQTSWIHGKVDFPKVVGSGTVSFVEIGRGVASQDGCSISRFPNGCIYAVVSQGGYQDPNDPNGIDQFIAKYLYLARMPSGTPQHHYEEVVSPLNWEWFAGFDGSDQPTWVAANDSQLAAKIRSLSYPQEGRAGCGVNTERCLFWNQPAGRAGHVNYPHMAYDAALQRYLLTFTDYYYRDVQPPSETGPMVQGGSELIALEASHPWGPWSFVLRTPYLGSGNAYGPSIPVQWQGQRTDSGQDLWMIWAANFSGCGKPRLVPANLCQGVYGMNLQRLHLTTAGSAGAVAAPWMSQQVGFASPGGASWTRDGFLVTGNGNLALRPDPFNQYPNHLAQDAFHFVFQRVNGNGQLEVNLEGGEVRGSAGPDASGGIMVREAVYAIGQTPDALKGKRLSDGDVFDEAARYVYLGVRRDGSAFLQWRDADQVRREPVRASKCEGGCSLRIVREANRVLAFVSTGQAGWVEAGSHTFSKPLSRAVSLGMVATSDSPNTFPEYATYSARFEGVRLIQK